MDKSVDSIGSCSLDVDAEITDFSDTSGSLNFPTPLSVKDIVREFTSNIQERCLHNSPNILSTNGIVNRKIGMSETNGGTLHMGSTKKFVNEDCTQLEKKPSYLNLACSVNGYSNLTTYDSKVRQDINKSREVSPIRPSTSSIQYCKPSNSLTPPVLHTMPHVENIKKVYEGSNNIANGPNWLEEPTTSFIQQRVERLYGPGALAQGFYSPRKSPNPNRLSIVNKDNEESELLRKFNELSPSKDYTQFKKKINNSIKTESNDIVRNAIYDDKGATELPVFRHLSEEFRAQLPISPKKLNTRTSPVKEINLRKPIVVESRNGNVSGEDVVKNSKDTSPTIDETDRVLHIENENGNIKTQIDNNVTQSLNCEHVESKKGEYFLTLLRAEQARILLLADKADDYINSLSNNKEVTDDVMGLLRSAAGKARLLVSQKMKQFEGLCHNNLKSSVVDQFPTTNDDLQGFWDMVYLQIDNIDSIFKEIETIKENGWKNTSIAPEMFKQARSPKSTKVNPPLRSNGKSTVTASASSTAALKREMQRKQFLEMKRKKRLEMASNQTSFPLEESHSDTDALNKFVQNI